MHKTEWTVFFLAKSIGIRDMGHLFHLLGEIQTINFDPHINVVFCINFYREHLDALLEFDPNLLDEEIELERTTMFFKLVRDSSGVNQLRCIGEKQDFDISNHEHLSKYLKKNIVKKFEAKRYLLFTWDHADGYGFFKSIGQVEEDIPNLMHSNMLTMEGLRFAIANSLGERQIDLMIMMNCYMQLFDTSFALRDHVKYIVAPQTDMGFKDYNYKGILEAIEENPEIEGKELGEKVVQLLDKEDSSTTNDISVSTCYAPATKRFVQMLNPVADIIEDKIRKGHIEVIKEKFGDAHTVHSSKGFVDFISLLGQLRDPELLRDDEITIVSDLMDSSVELIIEFFTNLRNCEEDKFKCHYGVSVFNPFTYKLPRRTRPFSLFIKSRIDTYAMDTEFSTLTRWGILMNKIKLLDESR